MNIKQYITFSFLFAPFFFLYGQTRRDTLSFRVVSYNVENLFDCRHDTLKNDYEFLPDAMHHWIPQSLYPNSASPDGKTS